MTVTTPNNETEYDPSSIDVPTALSKIMSTVQPILEYEQVDLHHGLDRVLASDVLSPVSVPPCDNSAMDGYAVRVADFVSGRETRLKVVGKAMAGHPFEANIASQQAVRIMTGAPIPSGADAVVMQELVKRDGEDIVISTVPKLGLAIRRKGEDIEKGRAALRKGKLITPADLGLVASLGVHTLDAVRRPRIAFFSTGDELRSAGESLAEGQIYDSNRYTISAMLQRLGVQQIDLGIVRDDKDRVADAMKRAAAQADIVITSGGASVGEADYIQNLLREMGEVSFWKIAMKPGKPLAFGKIEGAYFFGLPGNPVSAMVTFYQFVKPAILRLMGCEDQTLPVIRVKCVTNLKKTPGRADYQRGILRRNDDGEYVVASTGNQGSHVLSSMTVANCFIILPPVSGNVDAGSWVDVQPFFGLV